MSNSSLKNDKGFIVNSEKKKFIEEINRIRSERKYSSQTWKALAVKDRGIINQKSQTNLDDEPILSRVGERLKRQLTPLFEENDFSSSLDSETLKFIAKTYPKKHWMEPKATGTTLYQKVQDEENLFDLEEISNSLEEDEDKEDYIVTMGDVQKGINKKY